MRYNITAIFFCIDEFSKAFEKWEKYRLIDTGRKRYRRCEMTLSEMLTIMVLFHVSSCKVFKYFYIFYLAQLHKKDFPHWLIYNRFVQLMPCLFVPLCVLLQSLFGEETGIYINHKGSIVAAKITSGNVDERTLLDKMTRNLRGSLLADKGFISQNPFKKLFQRSLKLITGIRRNMKNYLMPLIEKILLRKRFLIGTIFDILKEHMNLFHTRHRSPTNC